MVQLITTAGPVVVADESIARIISRAPGLPYVQVWGPSGASMLETAEDAGALAARLQLAKPLSKLTAPEGAGVWIKAAAVTLIRPPNAFERETPHINCIVIVAGRVQALLEDFQTAYGILQVGGTHVPQVLVSLKTLHGEVQGFSLSHPKEPDVYQVW